MSDKIKKVSLPIYRAKIDIETLARGNNIEDYLYRVIRHYVNRRTIIKNGDDYYAIGRLNYYDEIEVFDSEDKQILKYPYFKTTLAIHFNDMLSNDSDRLLPNGKKDLRIFASLSEDGKGGDIVLTDKWEGALKMYKNADTDKAYYEEWEEFEVLGIQE